MKTLIWGFGIFALAFLIHLIIWRIKIPKAQTKTLIRIYFGTLVIVFFSFLTEQIIDKNVLPISFLELFHIFLLYTSLVLAYLTTYSALEVDSPSLIMVTSVANAGLNGLTKSDFNKLMTDDVLIKPRIRDLTRDNLAYVCNGKYRLTKAGFYFIQIFITYRKLLNAPKGG